MSDVSNLRDTIIPKSDQLNAEQLLAGPITVTVTAVRRSDGEQPVMINYADDNGRPYKPCKSMRKVLIFAWGDDGRDWVGKSMTLYNNPDVKFGGVKVGGIRISHLSHIERDIALSLTATKGKKEAYVIKRLETPAPAPAPASAPATADDGWLAEHLDALCDAGDMTELQAAFTTAINVNKQRGNAETRAKIVEIKDMRKNQLTAIAQAVTAIDAETGEVI